MIYRRFSCFNMIKYCFLRCILLTFLSIDLTKGINDQKTGKTADCDVLTENSANGEVDLILVHRIEAV